MKKQLQLILFLFLAFVSSSVLAQVTLPATGTSYTENFDALGSGLPAGFSIVTGASSTALGTAGTFTATPALWSSTAGGFKNIASNTGISSATSAADQGNTTNRALAVRQTGTAGANLDPGAGFVFTIANTTGKKSFKLSFILESIDSTAVRTTPWTVDYAIGSNPTTFTAIGTPSVLGGKTYTNNIINIDFGTALDNQSGPITIRIVALTGTSGSGSRTMTAIDNYTLTWSPLVAATPTLTVNPTSLDFGNSQTVNTTSALQQFVITGANLTAGATITTAAPYAVSTTGTAGSFGTTATVASAFASQTIYVQFTPTTTTSAPGTVTISSTGATNATVSLTGTGAALAPSLTASPSTLSFGNVNAGNTSVSSFKLNAANLSTGSATVSATSPYTVSKSNTSGFGASIVFTSTELAANPTVYVQFAPTSPGASNSSITVSDPDVTTNPSVSVSGTGVVPTLTATTTPATSPASIDFGTQTINTSTTKSYSLSGANLSGTTTVSVTGAGYTISRTSATAGFGTSITFTSTELASAQTVWVNFSPTTIGNGMAGSITNTTTGTGAVSATVSLTGNSVAAPVPALTVSPASLTFSATVGTTAAAQTFTLSGTNLSGATTVTVAAPYSISKTSGGTYTTSLSYSNTELATPQIVYVQFSPTVVAAGGVNNGSAITATAGTTNTQTVALNGTGIGVPALTVNPTALTFSQIIGTTATQTYTLSGVYLTANTTLTATGPYTISKDGSTFANTLTYTTTELATPQTVTVKFSPTVVATGGVNNGSVTNTTATASGTTTQTVTLNGTGLGVPTLTVSPSSITTSSNPLIFVQGVGSASAAQTFILTGTNITAGANTTLTTAAPFSISKDGTTYSTSLTYTAAELAAAQTISVKFTPTAITASNAATGNILIASTNATSQTVYLAGTGINTAPTLAAITDQSICYTTAQQSVALTGITPGAETNQIVIVSVASSNPTLLSSIGVLPVASGATTLNYTVANGQSGTTVITVTVKDNGGTANGGVDTYTRTFNLTVNPLAVINVTIDRLNNIVEKGTTATLTAVGGAAGSTYLWSISPTSASANIISSTTNPTLTIRPSVFATYTVTVTNPCGTASTKAFGVEVSNAFKLETSNVLTPNGDGKNDYWVVRNIDLYPGNTVKVFDKTGKLIYTKTGYNNDWNGYYNGAPLTQGTYYYVVDLGTGVPYRGVISVVRD